jgi:hypothetical protein
MAFIRIEFLGIYPDRLSVLAQVVLAILPIGWKWMGRPRGKPVLKAATEPGE